MRERVAMHQQKRRTVAALDRDDAGAAGLDLGAGKALHHAKTSKQFVRKPV
jgi:hypothetical protein